MANYQQPNREATAIVIKWVLWLVGIFIFLAVLFGVIGFVGGWLSVPGKVASPQNVEKQWDSAYSNFNSLRAQAQTVCDAEVQVRQAEAGSVKTQRESQLAVYQQNYRRIEADYNQAMDNAFKARLVKPPDLPDKAPSLDSAKNLYCAGAK